MRVLCGFFLLSLLSACGASPTPQGAGAGAVADAAEDALTCGAGTIEEEGACVAVDAGDGLACGEGTEAVDGACVPNAPAGQSLVCGDGTEAQDGACVPIDEGPRCGAGTVEVEGQCIAEGSGCIGDADCPRGLFCVEGGCVERICAPAERRCAAADIEVCDATGQAWEFRRACEHGCTEGACDPPICVPGARRCAGDAVEACDLSGLAYTVVTACASGCADGICLAERVCEPSARRCAGAMVEQCDRQGLGWEIAINCPDGCADGGCVAGDQGCDAGERRCDGDLLMVCGAEGRLELDRACSTACVAGSCLPAVCEAGARRCSGAMLEQCDARGMAWTVAMVCDGGCANNECQPVAGEDGGCPEAMRRCVGDAQEVCANDRWSLVEICEAGCLGGSCREPICQPGARRCDDADMEVEICSADGTEWRFRRACPTSCQLGQCLPEVCEAFSRRCNGLLPQQCNATGTLWVDGAPCNAVCDQGTCDRIPDGGCQPGHERCDGLTRQRCNAAFSWELVEDCQEACMQGSCVDCRPNALRCDAALMSVERCAADGSAWQEEDACDVGCLDAACTACVPGSRRCNGDVIEVCDADGQGWSSASLCLTSCDEGACTACMPNALRCNGRSLEQCVADGIGWELLEECGGRCEAGVCAGEAVCQPARQRCAGMDVQVCTPDAAGWLTLESCMDRCADGNCAGPACLPYALTATPALIPADGASSTLVVSDLVLDLAGNPVPDGTLLTVEVEGATLLAGDGDPNTPGTQVRTLGGRIDFAVRAPAEAGEATVSAYHPVAMRCAGETTITFDSDAGASVGLDFTVRDAQDLDATTASWDTMLGRLDPFPSDFGQGQDGDLDTGNYNINQNAQPGRLFPDAVNFVVTAVGEASATVRGGVGGVEIGDEVLLINLQGDLENYGNVGGYEIKEVARINYGENTLYFTTNLEKVYGATDSNEDLTGQKIMLQRVPRYRTLRVNGTMTADDWDGEKGGVFFVKVLGSAEILSSINMDDKGYRGATACQPAESYLGLGVENDINSHGGSPGASPNCNSIPSDWQSIAQNGCWRNEWMPWRGAGAGYAEDGELEYADGTQPGLTYGSADLEQWFLGSAGSGGKRRCCRMCNRDSCRDCGQDSRNGTDGGGLIVLWASGISVTGNILSRASGHLGGTGGTIFLRARSVNVGNSKVVATGGTYSSPGRIRLDFFGLSGTTDPEHHPGFGGDTVAVTNSLDRTDGAIASVTLHRVVEDLRGGALSYEVTNDGGEHWFEITPGETVDFGEGESDLRLKVSFANDNLQPLTLNGVVLTYTTVAPD